MNSSLRYAHDFAVIATLAFLVGCGSSDGKKELAAGLEALEARDAAKAISELEKSRAIMGDDVSVLVALARARLVTGELDDARAAQSAAASQEPNAADVILLGAQLAYHGKDYDSARKAFGKIAADVKLPAELRADGWTGLGIISYTLNDFDAAHADFLIALRLDRRSACAYYHLGMLYRNSFNLQNAALEQFEKFVYLGDPSDPRVDKTRRVIIPEIKDSIARALKASHGADRQNSKQCAEMLSRAETELRKGGAVAARRAIDYYQRALQADGLSYPAALGLAKAWRKAEPGKSGMQRSLECYKTACALKPGAVQTHLAAAALATSLGNHMQAFSIYLRAVAADGNNVAALDGLIGSLKATKRLKAAKAYQNYRGMFSTRK